MWLDDQRRGEEGWSGAAKGTPDHGQLHTGRELVAPSTG